MEFRDVYYLLTMLAMAVSGIVWVNNKLNERKNETDLVRQDLNNHKEVHEKLEQRVTEHESKIDKKLETLSEKMDGLKSLIIERIK